MVSTRTGVDHPYLLMALANCPWALVKRVWQQIALATDMFMEQYTWLSHQLTRPRSHPIFWAFSGKGLS